MTVLSIAACQITAGSDPEQNLHVAAEAVARAAEAGATLAVLPEATMASFTTPLDQVAQPLDGPFADGLRGLAQRHGITVVAGMFEPSDDGRVHNTLLLTGPDGEASYRKIHLYDAFGSRESDTVAPGSQLVTATVGGVQVGLSTCYDIRFADQFTALGRAGRSWSCSPPRGVRGLARRSSGTCSCGPAPWTRRPGCSPATRRGRHRRAPPRWASAAARWSPRWVRCAAGSTTPPACCSARSTPTP